MVLALQWLASPLQLTLFYKGDSKRSVYAMKMVGIIRLDGVEISNFDKVKRGKISYWHTLIVGGQLSIP